MPKDCQYGACYLALAYCSKILVSLIVYKIIVYFPNMTLINAEIC